MLVTDDDDDLVQELLQAAIEKIAANDPALNGAIAGRWFVVTEHLWQDGHSTLSTFESPRLTPWDALGLLQFATITQEQLVIDLTAPTQNDDFHEG
jgi:hypothetical protein